MQLNSWLRLKFLISDFMVNWEIITKACLSKSMFFFWRYLRQRDKEKLNKHFWLQFWQLLLRIQFMLCYAIQITNFRIVMSRLFISIIYLWKYIVWIINKHAHGIKMHSCVYYRTTTLANLIKEEALEVEKRCNIKQILMKTCLNSLAINVKCFKSAIWLAKISRW